MKKVLKIVEKYDNLLIILIFAIFLASKVYNEKLSNNDELINFLNTYKMANGLTIYRDTNVIITPLFFYIGQIILKIFDMNLLTFRTYNFILAILLYFFTYQIFKQLKVNKKFSLLYTLIIMKYTYQIISAGANYNVFAYCIYELGVLLMLKMEDGNKKDICQGLILFLVFLTNHKLAVGYFLAIAIYNLINKDIKKLFKTLLVASILGIAYLLYLYTQGNLYNFLNYTVLGIREFAGKNLAMDKSLMSNLIFILVTIFTIIEYVILLKIVKDKNQKKIFKIMLTFSLCGLIIILPISNFYHIAISNILVDISFAYGLHYLVEPLIDEKYIPLIINVAIVALLIISSVEFISGMKIYLGYLKITDSTSPFYGAYINKTIREELEQVSKYMKNNKKDTIMISTFAPFYSIKLNDLNNTVYDWALKGNLGIEGEKGLVEKIKKLENTEILLYRPDENEENQEKEIYQFTTETVEYIKQNMKCIGRIGRFDIYETAN